MAVRLINVSALLYGYMFLFKHAGPSIYTKASANDINPRKISQSRSNFNKPSSFMKNSSISASEAKFNTAGMKSLSVVSVENCTAKEYLDDYACQPETLTFRADRKCVALSREEEDFEGAKEACASRNNAQLVTLTKTSEYNDLLRTSEFEIQRVWIGMSSSQQKPQDFRWLETNKRPTLSRWGEDEPKNPNKNKMCVALDKTGKWLGEKCSDKRRYLCDVTHELERFFVKNWTLEMVPKRSRYTFGENISVVCEGYPYVTDKPYLLFEGQGKRKGQNYKIFGDSQNVTSLEDDLVYADTDVEYHRHEDLCVKKTIFKVKFYMTQKYVNGTLACCHNDDSPCSERTDMFQPLVIEAHAPELETFSDRPEYPAYMGGPIFCWCFSKMGRAETMTMVINTSSESRCGLFTAAIHLNKSIDSYETGERCVHIQRKDVQTIKSSKYDGGNAIRVTARMKASSDMDGAVCACFSYDAREKLAAGEFLDTQDKLLSFSNPIKIIYLPEPPTLHVGYHGRPSYVHADKDLIATCRAFLGKSGYLRWTLVTPVRNYGYNIITPLENHTLILEELSGEINTEEHKLTCPIGFSLTGSRCLHLSNEALNWTDARLACADLQAELVSVPDALFNWLLSNFVETDGYWIGLNSLGYKGTFSWLDTDVKIRYSEWAPEKDGFGISPSQAHCVYIRRGKWNPFFCSARLRYICEKPFQIDAEASLNWGRYVNSTLSMKVTALLDNATLRCESSFKNTTYAEDSSQFELTYEPYLIMKQSVKNEIPTVHMKCNSTLGHNREMSWVIFSKGVAKFLYTIDVKGRITEHCPIQGIDFKKIEVKSDNTTGYTVLSEATLEIPQYLSSGFIVACFGRTFRSSETLSAMELNERLERSALKVKFERKSESEQAVITLKVISLLLAFLVILIFLVISAVEEFGKEKS